MAVQTEIGMPLDEFIRQYDEAPFELVNGERIPLMPPVFEHGEIIQLINELLVLYKQTYPNIAILTETPVVLEAKPNWVKGSRVPDLMVYDKARLDEYRRRVPDAGKKPLALIPDLCVEVISTNDVYLDVEDKVNDYLHDGVRLVWVFNPRNKTIVTRTPSSITLLTIDDTLDGGDVLPGFSAPVQALFPE